LVQKDGFPFLEQMQRGCSRGAEHPLDAFPCLEQWRTDYFQGEVHQLGALRPLVQQELLEFQQQQVCWLALEREFHRPVLEA
jgi:hypothetical protein